MAKFDFGKFLKVLIAVLTALAGSIAIVKIGDYSIKVAIK